LKSERQVAVRCRNATRRRCSSVKLAAPLATCAKEEKRSVIRFLSSEEVKLIEIHRRMKVQCGDACLSLQQVYEWTRKLINGISSVTDSPLPGQAHPVVTPEGIAAVEAIVKENRRVTLNKITRNGDYTGCNRRKGPDFGRVFLMLNYTEKPQNTYIQS